MCCCVRAGEEMANGECSSVIWAVLLLHQSAHEASGLHLRSAFGPGKMVPGMLSAGEHRGDVCATNHRCACRRAQ